jgi:hypothetical protein
MMDLTGMAFVLTIGAASGSLGHGKIPVDFFPTLHECEIARDAANRGLISLPEYPRSYACEKLPLREDR